MDQLSTQNIGEHEKPWYTPALHAFLLHDVPRLTGIPVETLRRDVQSLDGRLAYEGESFLTKTLPSLGAAIDRALQGNVPLLAPGFCKRSRGSAIPAFLQGMLRRVFLDTGWLRDEPCYTCIRLLRQICNWCKKIQKGYSDESLKRAIHDFVEVDRNLPDRGSLPRDGVLGSARAVVEGILGDIRTNFRPSHGPGAVASGDNAIEKREWKWKYPSLEEVFRPVPFFFALREVADDPTVVYDRPLGDELSRTEFVEKDSKGPRTIGLEPAPYMWCQQSLKKELYHHIETRSSAKGQINFTDQSVNRCLTLLWWKWATLDMSKASDRNSLALVEALFENTRIWPYLRASRTPGTRLPDGSVLYYKKFAPMGSATCFPVQALVYYALACAVLHVRLGYPLFIAQKSVFVYGDDLIVPLEATQTIIKEFERYSLKFNDQKCCVSGKFRESCGADSFDSEDVTPVRMKKVHKTDKHSDSFYRSICEHSNELAKAGYISASVWFRHEANKRYVFLRKLDIPVVNQIVPILHWYEPEEALTPEFEILNSVRRVRGLVLEPKKISRAVADEDRLLHEVLSRGGVMGEFISVDGKVKERTFDVKYRSTLKKRWIDISDAVSEWVPDQVHTGRRINPEIVIL